MSNEFQQVQQAVKGQGAYGWWMTVLPQLNEEQHASLHDAAVDPQISHRVISIVLTSWGFPVTMAQVGHWRRNHVS